MCMIFFQKYLSLSGRNISSSTDLSYSIGAARVVSSLENPSENGDFKEWWEKKKITIQLGQKCLSKAFYSHKLAALSNPKVPSSKSIYSYMLHYQVSTISTTESTDSFHYRSYRAII